MSSWFCDFERVVNMTNGNRDFEDMDVYTFQERVLAGEYTDHKVIAQIVLHGMVSSTYNVYIDRRVVTTLGQVISPKSIVDKYGIENIKIRITPRPIVFPSRTDYRNAKR